MQCLSLPRSVLGWIKEHNHLSANLEPKIVSFFTSLFTPKDIVVMQVSYEGKQADEYEYKFLVNKRLDTNSIA